MNQKAFNAAMNADKSLSEGKKAKIKQKIGIFCATHANCEIHTSTTTLYNERFLQVNVYYAQNTRFEMFMFNMD